MGKIQDLPPLDRPREKALRYGIETLSDQELLTIVIGSGYKGVNAQEVAGKLLSNSNGLMGLSRSNYSLICKEKGIKKNKALLISTMFEIHHRLLTKENEEKEEKISTVYLYNKYKDKMQKEEQEEIILIILDYRKRIISEQILYKGSEKNVAFSYHEIWKKLYQHNGKYFYLIHNHPYCKETPSQKDIIFTAELFRESKRIGIPMIDHIIIGEKNYYSFLENEKK